MVLQTQIQVPLGLTTSGLIPRRYFARIIDSVVIVLLLGIGLSLLGAVMTDTRSAAQAILVIGIALLIFLSYGSVLESSAWQATVGKKILGLRVYGVGGGRISLGRALARNVVKDGPFVVTSVLPGAQLLGLLLLICHVVVMHRSPAYQAIHDRVAGALVAAPEETTQLNLS